MRDVSDPGGPVPPPGTTPQWYQQASVAPPPPGMPFQSTKKPKGRFRKLAATFGFLVLVAVIAGAVSLSGFGQKSQKGPPAAATANENPARRDDDAGGPIVGDHWHAAYGVFLCKGWVTDLVDDGVDANGIHTHGDGLIHIHPFTEQAAGAGATLGVFLDQVGMDFSDDALTMADGGAFGETGCEGQPTKLLVAVWPSADSQTPEVYESGFEELRFLADGEVWALAVVPEGGHLEEPPTVGNLEHPSDLEPSTTGG